MAETKIIQRLSSVVDIFVNDAFACAHRNTPSIVGFTHTLPCVAGELMKREIDALDLALETPARPCIAVVGGIKVEDSISIADNMLRKGIADQIWPTGGVANLLIEYAGTDIGQANHGGTSSAASLSSSSGEGPSLIPFSPGARASSVSSGKWSEPNPGKRVIETSAKW